MVALRARRAGRGAEGSTEMRAGGLTRAVLLVGGPSGGAAVRTLHAGPDELLPVANKPVLVHKLEALKAAGVAHVAVLGEADTVAAIRDAVGDGGRWDLQLDYLARDTRDGLEGALLHAHAFAADQPLLVERADALLRDDVSAQLHRFLAQRLDALALRFGAGNGEPQVAGYVLSSRAAAVLAGLASAAEEPLAAVEAAGGQVGIDDVDGCLACHGGHEALLAANRRVLEGLTPGAGDALLEDSELQGPVVVHPTARLLRTVVRGPAVIGAGTVLTDAYVGPYSAVGSDVTIEGAEIEHSIVMDEAELSFVGTRIETSVIGRGARVRRGFEVPSALRLWVGEGAEVALG